MERASTASACRKRSVETIAAPPSTTVGARTSAAAARVRRRQPVRRPSRYSRAATARIGGPAKITNRSGVQYHSVKTGPAIGMGPASVISWGRVSQTYRQRAFAPPPDATELIVVRHGASAALEPGETFELVEGHGDPPLAPEGREQAERVAERLRGEPIRRLFVTPLQRTSQTAAPLAAALGLEPEVVAGLREVHLGEWEGGEYRRRMHERDPIAMRALMEERWDAIPGAESMDRLAARVGAGLDA